MTFGKIFSNIMNLCCMTCRDPDRDKELLEMFKMTCTDPVLQALGLLLSFFSLKSCCVCQVQSSNTPSRGLQCVKENINSVPCGTLCERSWEKGESIRLYP